MRKILVLRGIPGSGKSTAIERMGLRDYTLSLDALRVMLGAPVLESDGRFGLDQAGQMRLIAQFRELTEQRMSRGEFMIADATHASPKDFASFETQAKRWRYDVALLDFSTVSLERATAQNALRAAPRNVPQWVLDEMDAILRANPSEGLIKAKGRDWTLIHYADDGSHEASIREWLNPKLVDANDYQSVVHIGDLQGTLTPLTEAGGPLEHGLDPHTLYIFHGDLLDRGVENGRVMRWYLDHALEAPNAILLHGNHEDHLARWHAGEPSVSEEFELRTLPQLLAANLTPKDAGRIVNKAKECFIYTFDGRKVLCTHAGLSTVPESLGLISMRQFSRGTGLWADPVDAQFDRQAPAGWEQVHGHRNHGHQGPRASPRSINLEDAVEYGGHLRVATLTRSGWAFAQYRNATFLPFRQRERVFNEKLVPAWMDRPSELLLPEGTLAALRGHSGVHELASQRYPHCSSFNFSREVFFEQAWDDIVVKARGLFIDTDSREIMARGYEKFFSVGEREETRLPRLTRDTLQFPVKAFVKENGFLGLLGFDPRSQELFYTTKRTPDKAMTDNFREIFEASTTAASRESIRRYLRDCEACLTFEVIDPVRDPHIIDYPQAKVVLLDVLRRAETFESIPYDKLVAFGKWSNLDVKEKGMVFKDAKTLEGWLSATSRDLQSQHSRQYVEGFVLEDSQGFQTKWKLPYYAFWKAMRTGLERLDRAQTELTKAQSVAQPNLEILDAAEDSLRKAFARDRHPLAQAFLQWAHTQPQERLRENVIHLRRDFLAAGLMPQGAMEEPWEARHSQATGVSWAQPTPQAIAKQEQRRQEREARNEAKRAQLRERRQELAREAAALRNQPLAGESLQERLKKKKKMGL